MKEELKQLIEKEGDIMLWNEGKYQCLILRSPNTLALCGYVGVPKSHPLYGKEYCYLYPVSKEEEFVNDIEVHGGLTFADTTTRGCADKHKYFFGFDAAHLDDIIPAFDQLSFLAGRFGETYKDMGYMKGEVLKLLEQLKEAENLK